MREFTKPGDRLLADPCTYVPAHFAEDEGVTGVLEQVEAEHDRQADLVDDGVLLLDLGAHAHAKVVEGHLARVPEEQVLHHVGGGQADRGK